MKRAATRMKKKPSSAAGLYSAGPPAGQTVRQARESPQAAATRRDALPAAARVTGRLEQRQTYASAIRPVRAADIAHVIALDEQVTGLAKAQYWQSLFERYERQRQTQQFFLVAVDEAAGAITGFIIGEIRAWEFGSAPCGWVYTLTVRPEARQRGLGQALFDALCAEFKRGGVAKTRTMVARDNLLVLRFFRAAGMMAGPYIELEKELD